MSEKALLQKALLALREKNAAIERLEKEKNEPIAVTGMGCRFPGGAVTPDLFWDLLMKGHNRIQKVPNTRWNLKAFHDGGINEQAFIPYAGLLDGIEFFDAHFFKISAREAKIMDPQQRLLLEVTWEALEDAGSTHLNYIKETGVFVGISQSEYGSLAVNHGGVAAIDSFFSTGSSLNVAAGRVSYVFGFQGPSMAVDTACSSSLVSLHLACQSLRNNECQQAVAGGVNLLVTPFASIATTRSQMLAKDGRCKTFDEAADGYVRSEGCGMVVLRRLSDALRDGNPILGVIKGSGVSQNGASSGLTVPNGQAQQKLISRVMQEAKVDASQVNYIEAHGTGTSLGDPIEFNALCGLFGNDRDVKKPLFVGSVKSNIGHLESAAGIAGFIKVILSLKHQVIPANLHFNVPSKHIDWKDNLVQVAAAHRAWPIHGESRLGGVSSFGFSGTNAHVLIEGAEHYLPSAKEDPTQAIPVFCLSAKSEEGLKQVVKLYSNHIASQAVVNFERDCYTTQISRQPFAHRLAVHARNSKNVQEILDRFLARPSAVRHLGYSGTSLPGKMAYLFSGYVKEQDLPRYQLLYTKYEAFKVAFDTCDALFSVHLSRSLSELLEPSNHVLLKQDSFEEALTFTCQYALASLCETWGLAMQMVCGVGIGEYAAWCFAGALRLEEAVELLQNPTRQKERRKGTDITAIWLSTSQKVIREVQTSFPALYSLNAGKHTVLYGSTLQLKSVTAELQAKKIDYKIIADFGIRFFSGISARQLSTIHLKKPDTEILSLASGKLITDSQSNGKSVHPWPEKIDQEQIIHTLRQHQVSTLLEIGSSVLSPWCHRLNDDKAWLALPVVGKNVSINETISRSLAKLFAAGYSINWKSIYNGVTFRTTQLPTYPFEREAYWFQKANNLQQAKEEIQPSAKTMKTFDTIKKELTTLLAELLEENPATLNPKLPFLEMGADSVMLMQASKKIENAYAIEIPMKYFFEELCNIDALSQYILEQASPPVTLSSTMETQTPVLQASAPASSDALTAIIEQQFSLNAQILNLLKTGINTARIPAPQPSTIFPSVSSAAPVVAAHELVDPFATFINKKTGSVNGNGKEQDVLKLRYAGLTEKQQEHMEALIKRITSRTAKSKKYTEESRTWFTDNRASAGFRYSTKEMLYPIVGKESRGSRMWDIDGNEYIDISMGFGVNLFGHMPEFVEKAITMQLAKGMQLGPQSDLAASVAQSITSMTNTERVAFCNSGTEAIMTAMRLARTKTGRTKIALFAGAYHGHFDGVLGTARSLNENPEASPVVPGVSSNMMKDLLVLDYDNPMSFELLQKYQSELAGVLVEPVQSRRPHLQPKQFLKELRDFTIQANIPLIFDEIITGFRIHSGGAQAHFDVQADIVTYGKVIGGGLPLGVIAGKAAYLDCIDGGQWHYGDATYPKAETTFFAGTFCKHPLTMATAHAVLEELKIRGNTLHDKLNSEAAYLVSELNKYFLQRGHSIKMVNFGSLFRFASSANIDLLFYHLLEKGIYVWEGRNCFLSTAHTREDVETIIRCVKESVEALEAGGFLQPAGAPKAIQNVDRAYKEVPTTRSQQQLWTMAQMDLSGSVAYNLPSNLSLSGAFDESKIESTLNHLINRHEALRSTISEDGMQMRVWRAMKIECPITDFSSVEKEKKQAQLHIWNIEESRRPFDMQLGPLFRFNLIKLSPVDYILSLTVHHILFDGWSIVILLKEVAQIYSSLCEGVKVNLPNPMQYEEYITARDSVEVIKKEKARIYWLNKFAATLPGIELPIDFKRPKIRTYNGSRISQRVERTLIQEAKMEGQRQGVTLFVTLLSAYLLLLRKLSGQTDFVVGIPSAGRFIKGSETVVGFCSYLIPIRNVSEQAVTFSTYLKQIRDLLLEGFEHENFSFAELTEKLNERESMLDNPLTRTVFNLDPVESFPALPNLNAKFAPTPLSFVPYDMALSIIEVEDGFELEWHYNTDLFERESVATYAGYFTYLLHQLVRDVHQPLSSYSVVAPETFRSRMDRKSTVVIPSASVNQLVEDCSKKIAGHTAIVYNGKHFTYRDLNERANQWSRLLKQNNLSSGNRVGIVMDKSFEMLALLLGIWKLNATSVAVDVTTPSLRMKYIFDDTTPPLIITQEKYLQLTEKQKISTVVVLDDVVEQLDKLSSRNFSEEGSGEIPLYIVYTSGSTGDPKGVQATQRGVLNYLHYIKDTFQIAESDVILQLAPVGFDASVRDTFAPLIAGASVVLGYDTRNMEHLATALHTHKVTCLLSTVPVLLSALCDHILQIGWKNETVRLILVSGEELSISVAKKVKLAFGEQTQLVNQYGPTECTMTTTYFPVTSLNEQREIILIGRPIPNASVLIMDELTSLPDGVVGEICIGGAGLSTGYFNKPDLSRERFIDHPYVPGEKLYRTGDLGRYRADGQLVFLGRIDSQVKIHGFRVELGEIETILQQHPDVKACVAVLHKENETSAIDTFIIGHQKHSLAEVDFRTFLKTRIPEYAIPATFNQVDEFPLTPNGKVDRKSLSKLRKLAMSGNSQNALPTTEVEMELTSIWKELLGVGQVGIHDEFFRLGGNSLKAIQLIGRIHKKFGKLLTMGDVFSNATIQKLGNLLEVTNQAMLEAVTPVPQAASYELSHAQKRLWIVSQFEENQVAYNISCKILVNEELDSDSLIFAFNESVARHEILRTIFVSEEGEPRQKVMAAEQVGFKVNYMDICHIANEQKEAIIQEEEVEKPFVLSEGPLLRISLFKLSDSRYCILCSTHHIISDGWSMNILLNDVLKIYRARVEGAPNPLSPLTIQYKDIAHWQNRQLTADKINELRNFWLQYFSGNLPVLVLPLDKRRPSTPSFNGNTIDFTIPADLARLLQKTAKDASTTIFSALVALVNTLLYRYSGQKDIVIGIPFGGRDRKEFENQIGFYINTLALRSELNAQTKFADFLDATKANMLAIFKHASYPFDLLVEDLKIKPQPGRSPLFDVMVQVQDTHEVILQEQNASVFRESAISTKLNSSKFDLTFNFTLLENSEQMEGSIEYNTDLFGLATIETMRDNFLHMASMALTDPSLVLSRANLLAKDIRTETLNSFVQSL